MIAPGLILTAAHCVPSYWTPNSASRTIRLGANKVDRPGGYPHRVTASCCPFGHMTVRATGAVSHPDWAGNNGQGRYVNDIALIFVEPEGGGDAADIPAEYSVCPSRAALSVGDDPVAMGLGATENDSSGQASWLQHSQFEIYDPSLCANWPRMELYEGQYAEHFYCTAGGYEGPPGFDETDDPDTYTFTCNGDSGSGLMKREGDLWEVAGVVSWGTGWRDDLSTRNCGVYPSSHVNLNHPESVSFIKPYLLEYRAAAGMAQCAGDWSS